MTTFLKIFLIAFFAAVLAHFCPVLLFPLALFGGLGALLLTVVSGGAAIVFAVVGGVVGLLCAVAFGLATVLSPLLVPALLIFGLVALVKALTGRTA
jgi:hypothetical protein